MQGKSNPTCKENLSQKLYLFIYLFIVCAYHRCQSGDRFVVKVKPVQIKGVRMIVEHKIEALPDRKLVLEGRATVVCLNKDFRPTRVFPELSARAKEVFSCKVA
jgi:acyl-CoA thioesterase FadM